MKYRSGLHTQHLTQSTPSAVPLADLPLGAAAPNPPPGTLGILAGTTALASLIVLSLPVAALPSPTALANWLRNRLLALRLPAATTTGRFWELDMLRGLSISLMIGFHALLVGAAATPLLAGAPALWKAMATPICYGPMAGFHAAALWHAPGLGMQSLDQRAQRQPVLKAALLSAYTIIAATVLSAAQAIGTLAEAFMGIAGLSMAVSHQRLKAHGIARKQRICYHFRRGARLFALGMGLTAFTWLLFPDQFIIFGILHLLGASIMLAAPFLELPPWMSVATGFTILATGLWLTPHLPALGWWALPLGFGPPSRMMLDYFPIFPWSGMLLLHTGIGRLMYREDGSRTFALPDLSQTWPVQALSTVGRHSLKIYLAQAPLTLGGLGTLS